MKPRLLSGIRPTGDETHGSLHLGHFVGALKEWIRIQNTGRYECFFLIADIQALTTHMDNPELIRESIRQVVLDWLAVGLDPKKRNVHFVLQSGVKELHELTNLLAMVIPFKWIEGNPTIKAEMKLLKSALTLGFIMYPGSQVADIMGFSPDPKKSSERILVPVGEDQAPHLEMANDVVRRFAQVYSQQFVLCSPLIGDFGRLPGTDGQSKMSKSLGNTIYLGDPPEVVRQKVMGMYTDPRKRRVTDRIPEVDSHPVFMYLRAFANNQGAVEQMAQDYMSGRAGDVAAKKLLVAQLNEFLDPIRERRYEAERNADVERILRGGTNKSRKIVSATVDRVRDAMGILSL